jgi:hypothetical protein
LKDDQLNTREGMLLLCALALLGAACGSGDIDGNDSRGGTPGNTAGNPGGVGRDGDYGNPPSSDRDDPNAPGAIGGSATGNGSGAGTSDDGRGTSGGGRGGGSSPRGVVREDLVGDAGSLSTATSIANDAATFTLPRAAVQWASSSPSWPPTSASTHATESRRGHARRSSCSATTASKPGACSSAQTW